MTTESSPRESHMLEQVRRWRREAYDADRLRTPEERAKALAELLRRFGLGAEGDAARSRTRSRP